jgi:hypothetical protein
MRGTNKAKEPAPRMTINMELEISSLFPLRLAFSEFDQPFATARLEFAFRELVVLISVSLLEVGDKRCGVCWRKRLAFGHCFSPNL